MSNAARPSPPSLHPEVREVPAQSRKQSLPKSNKIGKESNAQNTASRRMLRVVLVAENRLLREALTQVLKRDGSFEVLPVAQKREGEAEIQGLAGTGEPAVLLFASRGVLQDDLRMIRTVRQAAPAMKIVLIGGSGNEIEFVEYVKAGISGYLVGDASGKDILAGIKRVHQGEAVCPGMCCTALFRVFERDARVLVRGKQLRETGLTRREKQLVPLIAEGLTNKEIANRFCLSEQTVKNHLYRMKRKTGVEDRMGIVELCEEQNFRS